jgi:hypothetical protein
MTDDQRRQWNECACIPRCLIKLANKNGNPINDDQFAEQFVFRGLETNYGSFNIEAAFFEIIGALGLPTHREDSNDYSVIEHHFNTDGHRFILVMSGINLDPGETNVGKHCSVLTKIDPEVFSVWTPYQDGTDGPLPNLERNIWTTKECFGVVLF